MERLFLTSLPSGTRHTACVLPRACKVIELLECDRSFSLSTGVWRDRNPRDNHRKKPALFSEFGNAIL